MNRVKIVQICTNSEDPREIASQESLSSLGYRYIRIIGPRYTEYPPTHNVIDGRSDWVIGLTKPHGTFGLTSGHYGAWRGHKAAVLSSFADDDYSLICECDCLLDVDSKVFHEYVREATDLLESTDYKIVRFESPNHQVSFTERVSNNLHLGNLLTMGHCYMIHSKQMNFWLDRYEKVGWHTPDWWINFAFQKAGELMPMFKDLVLTKQAEGFSMIDNVYQPERIR